MIDDNDGLYVMHLLSLAPFMKPHGSTTHWRGESEVEEWGLQDLRPLLLEFDHLYPTTTPSYTYIMLDPSGIPDT